MTGNWFQCILLIMHLGKALFFIQILVSKLLYCISNLLFTQKFFSHRKEAFLISLTLLFVKDPNFYGLTMIWFILKLMKVLFPLKNFRVIVLTLSISYLHLRGNLKTGITSKESFYLPIIFVTNLHKFHAQFLKSGSKY